ncbi:MAG: hypothetical protein QXU47_06265 [Candidatus Bathyarchaeia archaeon]
MGKEVVEERINWPLWIITIFVITILTFLGQAAISTTCMPFACSFNLAAYDWPFVIPLPLLLVLMRTYISTLMGRKISITSLIYLFVVIGVALLLVYIGMQAAPEESKEVSTGSSSSGAILPVSSTAVSSIEEAARLLNASAPVRLPTTIPSSMVYIRIIFSSDTSSIYVFYADEPIVEENNPFVLMHLFEGWTFEDVEGGAPDMMLIIHRLDSESTVMVSDINTEEAARKYAEEFNLTYRMVDGIAVFGYNPVESKIWAEPIGVVHFYIGNIVYQIRTHLSFEEMVEIARSIIEQF